VILLGKSFAGEAKRQKCWLHVGILYFPAEA